MKRRTVLVGSLFALGAMAFGVQAAPPEGKGRGQGSNPSGKGENADFNKKRPDNALSKEKHHQKNHVKHDVHGRDRVDSHGRHYDYFDKHRDAKGRHRNDAALADLVYAGITAATAHRYARDYGLRGYSSLPPGIRKNLARGKPLPPGIAKKMVPGSLLGRLPRHEGYEWRIAGADLILIAIGTALVADVLYDVFD